MRTLSLGILSIFIQFSLAAQCLLREVPLRQRTEQSQLIIEGRVIAVHSFWNESHDMIYTSNVVEILKVFKGSVVNETIEVLTEGGIVGETMIKDDPSLQLNLNDAGIFFCERALRFKSLPPGHSDAPRYEALASVQGFVRYDISNATASDPFRKYPDVEKGLYRLLSPSGSFVEKKVFRIRAKPLTQRLDAIISFSPSSATAGTGAVLTINGSGFGATQGTGTVGFKNGNDGGATYINPLATQYLSWSDTKITVEVPSAAATGTIQVTQGTSSTSATALTITYSHLNANYNPGSGVVAYQTDHINDNASGGYTWQMNTNFAANAPASSSFMRAFDTWRCGTKVNWIIGPTTAINDAVSDGINVICFDNTAPLAAGVLGVCRSYWSGCSSGGTIVWFVGELDIIFDDGSNLTPSNWQFGPALPTGSEYDFETVVVHELGHGHQLGHVINPGAIMHYAVANGASNRSLSSDDLAGGNFVQSKSVVANVCGPGPMTAYTGCALLPIGVTSVKANKKNTGIQVGFTNEAESNVHHYEVEKSPDGLHFTRATTIAAKANLNSAASYEWYDENVFNGDNFYRVKAVSLDEKIRYSEIVRVNLAGNTGIFSVYPNPVQGKNIVVGMNNIEKGTYTITLYNNVGQQLMSKTVLHNGANSSQTLRLPKLANGLYQLQLQGIKTSFRQTVLLDQGN